MALPLDPQAAAIASPRVTTRRRDNRFYTSMGVVAFVVAMVGFNATLRGATGSVRPLVGVHAALYTAWLLLFIVQSRLIGSGQPRATSCTSSTIRSWRLSRDARS